MHGWSAYLAAGALLFVSAVGALMAAYAVADDDTHSLWHAQFYQGWWNGKDWNCCNDNDCHEVADEYVREIAAGTEINVEGAWCKVEPWMYLKKGNAPNWQTHHACVRPPGSSAATGGESVTPCDRLLCYQPKPGF